MMQVYCKNVEAIGGQPAFCFKLSVPKKGPHGCVANKHKPMREEEG